MTRRLLVLTLPLILAALLLPGAAGQGSEGKAIDLFNGKNFDGWKLFLNPKAKDAKPENVWSIKEGVIHCKGQPAGYMITDKEYGDYVLELEWRWPGKAGNSGVLCHVSGADKIWPKSWEAQLMAGRAGEIWLVDGFKMEIDKSRQNPKVARNFFRITKDKAVEKKAGEWNKYKITCQGDAIKLEINGELVNEGKNAERTRGKILLQSEGAPIEFRNIKLTPLKPTKAGTAT